jgi:pyruvate/2-oxoglutarate dehydrogenase complex dihydrolipoamide dehydrogenase (E3) component
MAQPERIETLVLGGGNGGMYLAWHMARSGRRTAVVERRWIGGSCPNINCLPSKNEIWSAKVADLVHHGASFGAKTDTVPIDMAKVRQRKRDMVEGEIAAVLQQYKASGAELIMGVGNFVAPKTLEVRLNDGGTRVLAGDQVFVNIGTHATIPSVPRLDAAGPLTNIEALELDYVPQHLIVLGGGYVGLEMALAYCRFGSRVTIIEHGPGQGSRCGVRTGPLFRIEKSARRAIRAVPMNREGLLEARLCLIVDCVTGHMGQEFILNRRPMGPQQ